jgi:ppGpp synthetase/RelA/SpoT-type nucleotidyltranferase
MRDTTPDPAEPIGEVTIVRDFLPSPEQLVPKENTVRVQKTILEEYDNQYYILEELQKRVEQLLRHLLLDNRLLPDRQPLPAIEKTLITSRVKARGSLVEKLCRKENKYSCLSDITDIVGFRIITLFSDTVDSIAEIVEDNFKIDRENSTDKRKLLDPDRFGYLSLHYVASLSDDRIKRDEWKIFKNYNFEIQIRSNLQHTWADINHDLSYKSEKSVPRDIKRRFSRIASLLEITDEEFKCIREEISQYKEDVKISLEKNRLQSIEIDQNSLEEFIKNENLVQDIGSAISHNLGVSIYQRQTDYSDTIEKLKILGISTLETLKQDLQLHGQEIIQFATEWIRKANKDLDHSFFTFEIALIHLCYIKLALLNDVDSIVGKLKYFPILLCNETQLIELATNILQTYQEIKVENLE